MLEVAVVEAIEEVLAHAAQMRRTRPLEEFEAVRREAGEGAAAIGRAGMALDEAAADQPIDQPGQSAAAEQEPLGEGPHPQRSPGGLGELQQDLVGAEGEVVLTLELAVEGGDGPAVGSQHPPPCGELTLVELGVGGSACGHGSDGSQWSLHSQPTSDIVADANSLRSEEMMKMRLEGIHHVTAITADAQDNVDFYAGALGLRMVKKTVNQDDPSVYHVFFADERGSAGSDITFFEFPGAPRGRAGDGMVHTVAWRVGSAEALDFWTSRLAARGVEAARDGDVLRFADPEGLAIELRVGDAGDERLAAEHPEVPAEHALLGFDGVRAHSSRPQASAALLRELGFEPGDGVAGWEARGAERGGLYAYDEPPAEPALQGAGTVHHVAWASTPDEHEAWGERVLAAGGRPTPVIDRFYFRSIYFREPSGVLFEIATLGPGFTVDEPLESLGEKLSLPPDYEHLRERVEATLKPIHGPRQVAA